MTKNSGQKNRVDPLTHLLSNFKVNIENGCWEWFGNMFSSGYGQFKAKNLHPTPIPAPRAAWMLFNGQIKSGQWVLHNCDNPRCVNPAHLRLGTPQDNVDDMVSRGRNSKGEDRPAAKLTDAGVREMRRLYVPRKMSYRKLAEKFGVTKTAAYEAVQEIGWKHVTDA